MMKGRKGRLGFYKKTKTTAKARERLALFQRKKDQGNFMSIWVMPNQTKGKVPNTSHKQPNKVNFIRRLNFISSNNQYKFLQFMHHLVPGASS